MKLKSKIVIILIIFLVVILIYIFLLKNNTTKNNNHGFIRNIESIPEVSMPKNTDIIFMLNESYKTGDKIEIKIKNIGNISYINKALNAPCALTYINPQGEVFFPPEAISCDVFSGDEIQPNEIVSEFKFSLKECVEQEIWRCLKSQPLAPGEYTIRGIFTSKDRKTDVLVEAQIAVVK